ncbi:MAG TPA: hypothetical protein VHJ37_05660 [Thermoleophilaceae bacterium]|jgi:hypothetical protein|nr:hypothetical protein [Thermoleophilaceae bacterium]
MELRRPLNGALAGATAAAVWAAQQPLDKRVFGSRYDDVELLGKLVTRGTAWPAAGLAIHLANGAIFGAVYALARPVIPAPPLATGVGAAMAEHVGFWPLGRVTDAVHPARDELETLTGNRAAFAQATWRHLLFGVVLGELERRLNDIADFEPLEDIPASSNGHGSLEQAAVGAADG